MLDKFAEELKEARLQNNITLQQMAVKSRIDIKFLEALESGDFTFLPELYVRAFIKEYAATANLDPVLTIKKYEAAKLGRQYEEPVSESPSKKEEPKKTVSQLNPSAQQKKSAPPPTYDSSVYSAGADTKGEGNKKVVLIGGIIIVLFFIALIFYFIFFDKGNEIIVPEKPIEDVIEESGSRYIDEEPPQISTSPGIQEGAASADSLSLNIRAKDTSWVKIILDDKLVNDFIMFPNSQKTIKASNNFKITFGKSGVIELVLNDKTLPFSSGGAAVTHVLINNSGLQYLNSPPTISQN
jgi:transcriptional regulator with XRE-family HTH domain